MSPRLSPVTSHFPQALPTTPTFADFALLWFPPSLLFKKDKVSQMDVHCHCHRWNYPEILENYVAIANELIKGWKKWLFWFQWLYHKKQQEERICFCHTCWNVFKKINPDWKAILYWCSCRSQRTGQKMFEKYIFCVTMTQVVDSTQAQQYIINNQMLSFAIVWLSFLTGAWTACVRFLLTHCNRIGHKI